MDLITSIIIIFIVSFFVFTFCGWCCRTKRPEMSFTTVTLPNATTTEVPAHMVHNPPYPQQQGMMPQPGHGMPPPQPYMAPYPPSNQAYHPPQPGFVPYPPMNQPPYPPYQPGFAAPAPGYPTYQAYPPVAGASNFNQQNPPTYDEATSVPYNKQAAYNPNFK